MFQMADNELLDLIKCLQEFENPMEFRNCNSNASKVKLSESERKSLKRYLHVDIFWHFLIISLRSDSPQVKRYVISNTTNLVQ